MFVIKFSYWNEIKNFLLPFCYSCYNQANEENISRYGENSEKKSTTYENSTAMYSQRTRNLCQYTGELGSAKSDETANILWK